MAIQNRAQIGWINCPMCDTRATVHACAVGRGARAEAKYWRCECGTIQPWKPGGQRFIAANFEPMASAALKPSAPPSAPEPETADKPQASADEYRPGEPETPSEPAPKPKRRGIFEMLLEE